MRRILAQMRKELTQLVRDRMSLAMALVLPVMIVFIVGTSFKLTVSGLPIVVQDLDGSSASRGLIDASYATSVPGAPEGQYVLLHYQASFANREEAVETLTLAFAKGYWRVSGYYIK